MQELNLTVYSGEDGINLVEGVPDEAEAQRLQIIHSNMRMVFWIVGDVSSVEMSSVLRDAVAFARKRNAVPRTRKIAANRASSRW
jgi:transcriptional regulator